MTLSSRFSIVAAILFSSHLAFGAQDPVRFLAVGRSSRAILLEKKTELEKAAESPIEINSQPTDVAMTAMFKDLVDGVGIGVPLEAALAEGEKKSGTKVKKDDFQATVLARSDVKVGVNPENPVKELTREQITGMLTGKIRSWEQVNGQKMPVKIIVAKQQDATEKAVEEYYLDNKKSAVAEYVQDANGLLRAMKANPGAIGFFTQAEKSGDFTPRLYPTGIHRESVLVMKKTARAGAQKAFDYLKANLKFD